MFYKLFVFIVIMIILYGVSDVKIQTSLYKTEDNVIIIQFPKAEWRDEPIFYMHCQERTEEEKKSGNEKACRFHREAGDGQEKMEHFQGF